MYLLDTNIPSELSRPLPDPRVIQFLRETDPDLMFISVLTYGEIKQGLKLMPSGRRRDGFQKWFDAEFPKWLGASMLDVTQEIAEVWSTLSADAKSGGVALKTVDGLIAATALVYDLTLVTRNVRDFTFTGVSLFNPWELEASESSDS